MRVYFGYFFFVAVGSAMQDMAFSTACGVEILEHAGWGRKPICELTVSAHAHEACDSVY